VNVDHTTIYRWVQRYAPLIQEKLKWYWRPRSGGSWKVDETYIKVKGKWVYLYLVVDRRGETIAFLLSTTRNAKAA
jgi:transposase-like protein